MLKTFSRAVSIGCFVIDYDDNNDDGDNNNKNIFCDKTLQI